MENRANRLLNLNDQQLIDVVKNYRQYGFSRVERKLAVDTLASRGLTTSYLRQTGNFDSHRYERAHSLYRTYSTFAQLTLAIGAMSMVSNIGFFLVSLQTPMLFFGVFSWLFMPLPFVFLGLLAATFWYRFHFMKLVGKPKDSWAALACAILGFPVFVFLYFHYREQMQEELKMIV